MARKNCLMLMALLLTVLMNCGNDTDDGNDGTGGSGGETVDSGAKDDADDAGEAAADGLPNGGDDGRDAAADGFPNGGDDAGSLVVCRDEMNEWPTIPEECAADDECASVRTCTRDTACSSASDCYSPETCREVIDNVGLGSQSLNLAVTLGECIQSADCSCPWVADADTTGTFTISGTVTEFITFEEVSSGKEYPLLSDVEICVLENDDLCTTTLDDGTYTLEKLPSNAEFYLSFFKDGYRPDITVVTQRSIDLTLGMAMVPDDMAKENAEAIGASYPDDTMGSLEVPTLKSKAEGDDSIFVLGDMFVFLEGATISLQPESGMGPFYKNSDEQYDSSLTETSEAGMGSFFNLDPGEYTISVSHPTLDCSFGASGLQAAPEKVKIVPGYCTRGIGAICN